MKEGIVVRQIKKYLTQISEKRWITRLNWHKHNVLIIVEKKHGLYGNEFFEVTIYDKNGQKLYEDIYDVDFGLFNAILTTFINWHAEYHMPGDIVDITILD